MKILVPIDFSSASRQALRYAAFLAKKTKAQLYLLHVFEIPVMTVDATIIMPSQEEINTLKEDHLEHLKNFVRHDHQVQVKFSTIHFFSGNGYATEKILDFSKQEEISIIIMGIQGKCVKPSFFMGSTFIRIMRQAAIPVVGLHSSTRFTDLKNILLAYDLKEFSRPALLQPLVEFAKIFNAHIHILSVCDEINEFPLPVDKLREHEMSPEFINQQVSFHILQNKNAIEGIKEFLQTRTIDLICFVPRSHGLFFNLFKESTSRKAAFEIDLPLMSIHN